MAVVRPAAPGWRGRRELGILDRWAKLRETPALEGLGVEPLAALASDLVTTKIPANELGSVLVLAREGQDASGPFLSVAPPKLDRARDRGGVTVPLRPMGSTPAPQTLRPRSGRKAPSRWRMAIHGKRPWPSTVMRSKRVGRSQRAKRLR